MDVNQAMASYSLRYLLLGFLAVGAVTILGGSLLLTPRFGATAGHIISKSLMFFLMGYLVLPSAQKEGRPPLWSSVRLMAGLALLVAGWVVALVMDGIAGLVIKAV